MGLKRPKREADHSPHLVPRSKNEWSYTYTPQYVFMAWCLVKQRDNFTFIWKEGEGVDWMHLDQDRDQCQAFVNTVTR
jgi:hypothetical protein